MRLSAHAVNSFDTRVEPGQKLAGMQLQHFGGFYKSSWRANDWMWGRLDGAARLVDVILDAERLRLVYNAHETDLYALNDKAGAIAEYLVAAACDGLDDQARGSFLATIGLTPANAVAKLTDEIALVLSGSTDLSRSRKLARARLQLDILREELPVLAKTIGLDATDGAARPPDTARWLQTWERA